MTEILDVGDQPRDYRDPEERRARDERRREREAKAEAFAEVFVKEGSLSRAAKILWPEIPPAKAYDKARTLSKTQTFQDALPKVTERMKAETNIGPEWVLRRLKAQAETAVRAADRIRALELIAKHLGMFIERKEVRSMRLDLSTLPKEELIRMAKERIKALEGKGHCQESRP